MKYLTIIFLTLTCKWVDIPVSDIKTEYVGHVMIGDYEKLEYEGSCGGTAGIEAHFDRIQYCDKSNRLRIQGKMTTDYGEPYPYMSFVTGKDLGDRIDRSSKTLTSDSTATFDLTIDYKEGDDLFIFGVGSYVLKTTTEIK